MDAEEIESLLLSEESVYLDFKETSYPFEGVGDEARTELLKDILAFANARRSGPAYILVGVRDVKGGRSEPMGVDEPHDDASLQQFFHSKTNRPIAFSYKAATVDGKPIGVFRIEAQKPPFYLKKRVGRLEAERVYVRIGTTTAIASPDEIFQMGETWVADQGPKVDERLRVSLTACSRTTPAPPYGTGEPLHLEIKLAVTNDGHAPIFIGKAILEARDNVHCLEFSHLFKPSEPLQAGEMRTGTLYMMYHRPFPGRTPDHQNLRSINIIEFEVLLFVCQDDSVFRIVTGRGNTHEFPVTEVCDEQFYGWPILATPKDILQEIGSKTLEDFREADRLAWERASTKDPSE